MKIRPAITNAVFNGLTMLILSILSLLLINTNSYAQTYSQTTAGTYSWTCPIGVTSVVVQCWGGGGGGAGSQSSPNNYSGGGGAGGNYSTATINVTPGQTYTVVVGAGGLGGAASSTLAYGGDGGTSSFGTSLYASGGSGGGGGMASNKSGVGGVIGGVRSFTVTNAGAGYSSAPTVTVGTAWSANQSYTVGQQFFVSGTPGRLYTVTTAGNSGTTTPTGTSTFTCSGGTGPFAVLTYAGAPATATASVTGTSPNMTIQYITLGSSASTYNGAAGGTGSGYISQPTVTITGGGSPSTTATATANTNIINVTGATTFYLGGNGGNGSAYTATSTTNASGGGGASAGTGSNGGNASGTTAGTAVTGGGAGAAGNPNSATAGQNAPTLGGGGGGATGSGTVGGNGFAGKVTITYPVISTTGTLLAFTTTLGNASASQSFTLSGANMNAGIKVKAPSDFEVSSDNTSFTDSITLGSAGTIASSTVYARIKSTAAVGSYNGLSIAITSSGAANVSVSIPNSSVTSVAVASVTVSTSSLTAFANTAVGSSSTTQNFTVAGSNLGSNDITVTAPTNFQVSTSSSSGFASSLTLTPSSGTVAATTIYARYTPSGIGANSGNITISQADVSDQTISVSGAISTYYYQSGSLASTASWTALSDGTGTNPANFTTAGITYKILNNATTDAAWAVSGTGSKIVVGDAGAAATTLTIAAAGAVTGIIDIAAASSGSNSVILQTATQPTFGTLHSTSEVHYRATMTITTVPTDAAGYGKFFVDGGSSYTVTLGVTGNTPIQTSLTVDAGSKFSTSASSGNFITIASLGSATINGTIYVAKAKGLLVAGTNGSTGGAIGFAGTDNLTLGAASTVEYNKGTNASTYNISPLSYANLTISGLDNNKAFTAATSVSGTFTLNMTTSTSTSNLTGCGNLTLGNGANIIMTSGALDAAPTFGSSVNVTYNGTAATICSYEIPTTSTILNNLTVNNAGGVYLSGTTTINGTLTLTAGTLNIVSNSLVIAGNPISIGSGSLVATSSSNLSFSGSNAGPFSIPATVTALNNLTINNSSSATVNAAAGLTLSGTLSLTSGNLAMGAFALTLNGPAISGSGALTMTGALSFGGSDAGPLNIPSSVTSLTALTLNNTNAVPATLNLNGAISCTGLALTSGTVADGGYTLTVAGNITGTGTHTGAGKIKMSGTSRTISAVKIQNFEVGLGASVSSSAATFAGTFDMNGGNFTAGTGNTTTWLNGVTINRNTIGQFNVSGGAYAFGTASTDRVNVVINASVTSSAEFQSSPTPGRVGNLTINSGSTYTIASAAGRSATNLVLNGALADAGCTVTISGNISGNGSHTGTGKIAMKDNTVASTISAVTLNNVDFNDADGFTLNGNLVVNGTMNLVAGTVSTGSNTLKANSTVSRTSGWVNGNLQKPIVATGAYNFEVGTTAYSPASMNITAVSVSGNMTVKANTGLSSQAAYATLDLNKTVALNRYWSVSGADGLAVTYAGTYSIASGDSIGVPTLSALKTAVNSTSTSWVYPGTVTANTSSSVSAASTSSFGDVVFASPITISVTADNLSKNENDADPTLTYTTTGTLGSGASFTGAITRDAGESAGVYAIRQGTLAISPNPDNYSFTFNNGTFSILGLANPITNFTSTHKSNNIVRLTWTSPIGVYDNILIFARPTSSSYTPSGAGSDYTNANADLGSAGVYNTDNYLVYSGSGNSVEITGLSNNTDYNFSSFTYTGSNYAPVASLNVTTAVQPTTTFASAYGNAQSVLSWTNPSFFTTQSNYWDEVIVVAKSGSAVDQTPSGDGSSYNANATFGSGTDLGSGNYVVYKGTGTTATITGLTNGTAQHFKTFVRHGSAWSEAQSANVTPNPYAVGDYGSLGSGMWTTTNANWRKWDGASWSVTPSAAPTAADNVFILSGHTVRTDATIRNCKNLTVEGTLKSDSLVNKTCFLRVYGSTIDVKSGAAIGTTATGNNADGISLDLYSSNITITGSGTVNFSRIRHSDSTATSTLTIDNDVTVHYHGSSNGGSAGAIYTNSPMPTSYTVTHVLTINPGKTLTFDQYACYTPLSGANNNSVTNKIFNINGNMTFLDGTIPGNTATPISAFIGNQNGYFNLGASTGFSSTINIGSQGTLNVSEFYPNGTQSGDAAGLGTVSTITVAAGGNLNVSKIADFRNASQTVTGAGSFTLSSGAVMRIGSADGITTSLAAGPIRTTTRTYNSGHYKYEGTVAQVTGNALPSTINALTLNNAAGLTLTNNTTASDSLVLASGVLTTNTNTFTVNGSTTRTSGWVAGNLKKSVAVDAVSKAFEIGDATSYRPVTLTLNGVTVAGGLTATVSQTNGAHPNISTSNVSRTNRLNRYWTLTNDGVTLTNYAATFNFVAADILNSADTALFIAGIYNGSSWSYPTVGTKTSTSTQITGATSFGDYQVGENCTTTSTETLSSCDSLLWHGTMYYASNNTATWTGTNAAGCDSIVTLNLTITSSTSNSTPVSICDSYTWSVNGQTYTTSGSYTSVSGCATEILNLTITSSTSNTTPVSVCDSYTWSVNSQTYTTSGSYTSVSGCATEILDLTITASTSNSTPVSVCDSYTWSVNSQTYTTSGSYTSVSGCATEILNLTITASTSNTTPVSVCDSYTWSVNSQTYTTSGSYTSVSGCATDIY